MKSLDLLKQQKRESNIINNNNYACRIASLNMNNEEKYMNKFYNNIFDNDNEKEEINQIFAEIPKNKIINNNEDISDNNKNEDINGTEEEKQHEIKNHENINGNNENNEENNEKYNGKNNDEFNEKSNNEKINNDEVYIDNNEDKFQNQGRSYTQ